MTALGARTTSESAARELIRSRKQAPAREEIEHALDELPELEPIPDNSRTHAARHDLDEAAMWRSDESANPDSEVYSAVLPSLIRTQGLLVVISTGYRRAGLRYDKWRAHFGSSGDPGIRNVQAGSMPCTVNFAKLEKPLPEGLTRRVGSPRILELAET